MMSKEEQEAIDAALDAALDELDDESETESAENGAKQKNDDSVAAADPNQSTASPSKSDAAEESTRREEEKPSTTDPFIGPPRPPSPNHDFVHMVEDMLLTEQEVEDPEEMMCRLVEQMRSQLNTSDEGSSSKNTTPAAKEKQDDQQPASDRKKEVDDAISSLVKDLSRLGDEDAEEGDIDDDLPLDEKEMLNSLMQGLDGKDFNADAMIDGMMEQLLSKDLMYEPMQQVANLFPQWLEDHKDSLSEKEYKEREKQCECFQKLVKVYETTPDDTKQLMFLMQEVQEFGQPPAEIIKEIAPGIELDANGMPKLDDESSSAGILPFLGGEGQEECRIM